MQSYNFHFLIQLSKWIFRGFSTQTKEARELKLQEALQTDKPLKFTFEKENGEIREAVGKEFRINRYGNVLYHDIEKGTIRSFKPENLIGKLKIA